MTLLPDGKNRKSELRARALVLVLVESTTLAAIATVCAPSAMAQGAQSNFNIPAQPLASALNAFGQQSGLQVSIAAANSQGVDSRAVFGLLSPETVLGQMLEGTGLSFGITNGTALIARQAEVATPDADALALAPIVLEAQRTGQGDITETVIDLEQIERLNPTSIADVFREEAGVQVGSSLPMSQKVYVRGVEETNLAVSIDGARQNNKVFHHNATNLIDPSLLRAIDVDAGIAPADAGPGALAGAINYETRDAADLLKDGERFGGFVTSTYNFSSDTAISGLSAYGRKSGFDFLGYLTLGKGNEFQNGDGIRVEGTETNLLSGLGKFGYEFESGDRIEISHDRVVDDAPRPYRANSGFVETVRDWEPRIRDYKLERRNTVFTYSDEAPEGWWDPKMMLAYGATEVTIPIYGPPGRRLYDDTGKTSTLNGKFENKFSFDIGSIVAGIDFYRDRAELEDPDDAGREKAFNTGTYAQARLEPWDRTRLSVGARADRQRFTGVDGRDFTRSGISTNTSIEYDLTDIWTAKAGFSHVWAGVPLTENFIINPDWDYGADGPRSVSSRNYMIGMAADYDRLTAEISLFRTVIENARTPFYRYPDEVLPPFNGALHRRDLDSKGFELGAGYRWSNGYVRVKYVHIDVDVDGRPASSDSGNYLASPVGDIVTITAAHTFENWGLTVGGDLEIAPEYDHVVKNSDGERIPYAAYEVANLFAEWTPERMSHFSFRAEVRNVFAETYAKRASYGQEFSNVTPLFEPGRSFLVTVKATF